MGSSSRLLAFALLFFGIGIRIWNLLSESRLWLDEIFSVGVAESPTLDGILTTLRFDTHPPLYYMQLHFWSLLGQSDFWYILNSTLWSLASLWVMYVVVKRLYGREVGLWAAAIFALLPLEYFFAENVRMYAFVAVLQIVLWGLLETHLRAKEVDSRRLAWVALTAAAITLSHGLGFFVVFANFFQAGARELLAKRVKRLIALALSYVPAAACAAWPLVIGSFRRTEGLSQLSLSDIGVHLTLTVMGLEFPAPVVAGFIVFPLIAALCFSVPQARVQLIWLVLVPFAMMVTLSVLVKPILIYRTMGLFLPYLAIAMGIAAQEILSRRAVVAMGAMAAVLLAMLANGVNYTMNFSKEGFRAVVGKWHEASEPNALIIADRTIEFWAIQRYLDEGVRHNALDVQPPVRDAMQRLKDRLDNTSLSGLGFFGRSDHVTIGTRTLSFVLDPKLIAGRDVVWLMNPVDECQQVNAAASGDQSGAAAALSYAPAERLSAQGQTILACRVQRKSS